MTLYKQLWLAVIGFMVLIFSGNFVASSLATKSYFEQQLYSKNTENASALALTLTQQNADPVLQELTLSAQFDSGYYELLQLTDPKGNIVITRQDSQTTLGAPQWFTRLFPIEAQAAVAKLQLDSQHLGTLTVRSHTQFAYRELWNNMQRQAAILLLAILIAGFLGSYILKRILRPLDDVVCQAKAIGERRFITIAEPDTLEFKAVVNSMNNLSKRIQAMLKSEALKLEKWRQDTHADKITGLASREAFLPLLIAGLERDDASASGVLTLIRIADLARLNQRNGRKVIDTLLASFGQALTAMTGKSIGWTAGRLNGSDFAILAPRAVDPAQVGRDMQQVLREVLKNVGLIEEVRLPGASGNFQFGDKSKDLLSRLDAALLASDAQGESGISVLTRGETTILPVKQNTRVWMEIFDKSFSERSFSLATYPVTDLSAELIHEEGLVRLEWDGKVLSAGQFLPWINRLDLAADLDRQVVSLALSFIQTSGRATAINLSFAALSDPGFLPWLSDALSARADTASQLSIEIQEATVYRHLEAFKKLCIRVKVYGSKIGIEHVGHQLSNIGLLHDVGLDYIKIDPALVREVDSNPANQVLLKTLGTLGHSIGVMVVAQGVNTAHEWSALESLGIDGATGPEATLRRVGKPGGRRSADPINLR